MEDATTNDARTPHYYPSNPAGCSKVHRLFGRIEEGGILLSFFSFYFSSSPPLSLFSFFFLFASGHIGPSLSPRWLSSLCRASERNCGHTSASRDIRHYNGGVSRVGRFFAFLLFLPPPPPPSRRWSKAFRVRVPLTTRLLPSSR